METPLLSTDASKINKKSKLIAAALNSWDQLCPKYFFSSDFFLFEPQREKSSCCWLFVYSQPHQRRLLDVLIRKVVAESLQLLNSVFSCCPVLQLCIISVTAPVSLRPRLPNIQSPLIGQLLHAWASTANNNRAAVPTQFLHAEIASRHL